MNEHRKENGRNSFARISRLALVVAVIAVVALGTMAAISLRTQAKEAAATSAKTAAAQRSQTNSQATQFAQQTGGVRPLTQAEAQKLAAELKTLISRSTDGLKSVKHADGSVSIDLQGRFRSVAVAKRDENGNWVQSCIDNREGAAAFFEIEPELLGIRATVKSETRAERGSER